MAATCWIAYLITLGLLATYGAHRLTLTIRYWRTRSQEQPPRPLPPELPVVTVQLPLFNERCVAERLIDAVVALDWPRERLQIQVLDDSTDETTSLCGAKIAHLRAAGHEIEHLHRKERTGFKAGALEAGLQRAMGKILLVLDADFVPPPQLLRDTVGCFEDPDVGMVQVRWEHLNRESDLLTRLQALLLDGHFVIEQTARARSGLFFNFNGTAGLWRREAIEQAGGWHHDTLTEDLDLSYRALLHGWRFVYMPQHMAPAELPADVNAFKSQQFRWAKGSVQVARKLLPRILRAPVPLRVKMEAFLHLTQNVPYLMTLVLLLLTGPALVLQPAGTTESLWIHLPMLLGTGTTLGTYCVISQRALGRSVMRTLLHLPALIAVAAGISVNQARAVVEGAIGHASEFVRTPKRGLTGVQRCKRGKSYRGLRNLTYLAELALAAYCAGFLVILAASGRLVTAIPLALFAAGLTYIGIRSVFRL